jgi:hypothetical protein
MLERIACSKKHIAPEKVDFCAVSVHTDIRPRPVVSISIEDLQGVAYIDTCAKTSVASFALYTHLKQKGYQFKKKVMNIALADGISKTQNTLAITVSVSLCGRIIPTSFIVLLDSRDNKTLLGIGFLADAGIIIDVPQFMWYFNDEVDVKYELYGKDFLVLNRPS